MKNFGACRILTFHTSLITRKFLRGRGGQCIDCENGKCVNNNFGSAEKKLDQNKQQQKRIADQRKRIRSILSLRVIIMFRVVEIGHLWKLYHFKSVCFVHLRKLNYSIILSITRGIATKKKTFCSLNEKNN